MDTRHVIDWILLDHADPARLAVGDLLSVDAGGMPIYRVTALASSGVWLEDDRHHAPVQVRSLAPFRWRGAAH